MKKLLLSAFFAIAIIQYSKAQNPYDEGEWSDPVPFGIVPVAVANLPNGKLLMWSSQFRDTFIGEGDGATFTEIYDPFFGENGRGEGEFVANLNHDMFCPGINNLADGRILSAGGTTSSKTSIYDPSTGLWSVASEMNIPRGYQGNVTLTDGSVFTLGGSWSGGSNGGKNAEIWSAETGWINLPNVFGDDIFTQGDANSEDEGIYRLDNHAWLWAASNGKIFHAGPGSQMHWIDPTGLGTMTQAAIRGSVGFLDGFSMKGTTVMFDVDKILKVGGARSYNHLHPGKISSYVIDFSDENNIVQTAVANGGVALGRTMHNSTVLPNGEVLVTGGLDRAQLFTDVGARLTAELYNPGTNSFRNVATMAVPRTYHSVSILLVDGRVFVGGGGLCDGTPGCVNHFDAEIYSPPYLFNPDGSPATRPTISAPDTADYNTSISVTGSSGITDFSLVRFSAATHSTNNEQRRIPVTFSGGGGSYGVNIPDRAFLPPGYYMLFGMDANGVPSIAETIRIGNAIPLASNPNLVVDMRFDEGSGSVAMDSSGFGNNGTISDVSDAGATKVANTTSWGSGLFGGALQTDGVGLQSNTIVDINYSVSLEGTNDALTIMAWVNRDEITENVSIFTHDSPKMSFGFENNLLKWEFETETGGTATCHAGYSPTGQWVHMAASYDGEYARLYANGVEIAKKAVSGNIDFNNGGGNAGLFTTGGMYEPSANPGAGYNGSGVTGELDGRLDELKVFNVALGPEEIGTYYNTGVGVGAVDCSSPLTVEYRIGAAGTWIEGNNANVAVGDELYVRAKNAAGEYFVTTPQANSPTFSSVTDLPGQNADAAYQVDTFISGGDGLIDIDDEGLYVLTTASGCPSTLAVNVVGGCPPGATDFEVEFNINNVWCDNPASEYPCGASEITIEEGERLLLSTRLGPGQQPDFLVPITLPDGTVVYESAFFGYFDLGGVTVEDEGLYIFTSEEGCERSLQVNVNSFDCNLVQTEYNINGVWCDQASSTIPCGESAITVEEGTDLILSITPNSQAYSIIGPNGNNKGFSFFDLTLENVTLDDAGTYLFTTGSGCEVSLELTVGDIDCSAFPLETEYNINSTAFITGESQVTVNEGDQLILSIIPNNTFFSITGPNGNNKDSNTLDLTLEPVTLADAGTYTFTTNNGCSVDLDVTVNDSDCAEQNLETEYSLNNTGFITGATELTVDEGDDLQLSIVPNGIPYSIAGPNGITKDFDVTDLDIPVITENNEGVYTFTTGIGCEVTLLLIVGELDGPPPTECSTLPSPWVGADIGDVGAVGSSCYVPATGTFEVEGSGADIWGISDEFHYVYQPLSGDGEIIARVVSQDNTFDWAKAGVMIRNGSDPGAEFALMTMLPNPAGLGPAYAFQYRDVRGELLDSSNNLGLAFVGGLPYYIRLVREGNTFTGYASTTNGGWQFVGSAPVPMGQDVLIGLAVSSRNDGVLGKAVFDNVSTSGGGPSVDTTPPVISLLGDNPLVVDLGDTYVEPGATATDNVDGDLSGSIVIDAGSVDTGTVGSYQVSYDVTDSSNNAAATVTRTVNVVDGGTADTTPPVIALLGDNPLVLNLGDTYVEPGATATDNVDGDLSGSIVIDAGSVDTGTVGSYQVSYDVTDSSNNAAATVTRTVNVVDGGSGDCGPLPSPWVGADIGDVGADGSSCYVPATGTFEVEGSGADIWGISDEFHYVYQPLSGDGEIIARVVSQDNTFDWAKAGVMIRNGSDPGAEFALMTMLPNPAGLGPAYAFQYRDVVGEFLDSSNNLGLAFVGGLPYYIRLVREGNTFTGYASTTNGGWQFVGSAPVPMGQDVLIGLAVSSRNDGVLGKAVFDNVSTSGGGPSVDTTPPVISLLGDNPLVVDLGDTYVEPGATATDNVDGDLSGSIVIDAGSVDTGTVGSYQVSYDVTDSSNNAAATVTRTVNVVDGGTADTTPPVIALLGDNPLVLNLGDTYVEPGATATDNVDGDLSGSIVIDAGSVDTGTVGSYQVSYDVTDSSNNAAATVTRTVNVVDGGSGDCGPLPSPWVGADIGDVGAVGSSCYVPATGTFEVEGSGADIWGISDEFHYVYQPLSGDGEIIARVVSQDNTFDWAKAGVMIRNGSDPGAEFALMTMLPNPAGLGPAYAFQYRDVRGELLDSSNNLGLAFVGGLPYYIRLVREGNTFTGYASTTNGGWQFVGSAPVPMGQDVLIGLAVSSRNDGVLGKAVFDNVSTSGGGPSVDTTPPVISLLGDNPLVVDLGDTYVEPGATATDNVDGDLSGSIVIDAGSVDTGTVGSYQVSYDVTDSSNNAAATVTRTVNVVDGGTADTTPPVIALLGDNPLVLNLGDTYVEPGATATDNVDGDLSGSIVIDAGSVDTGTVGSYQVSYDVTDSSNNAAATVTRTVNVVDGGSGDCGPLPSPWVGADIGDVGAVGSSCYVPATGTFEVEGSGADIWGISDEFHYVYQPLSGDGEIIARVVSQDNTFDWAKAGVMIRNGSDPGAEFALMTMLPNPAGLGPAYAFQYRDVVGEFLDSSNNLGLAFVGGLPYYIRLVREGNTFTGYASTTNGGWQFVGSAPVPMGQDVLIGLAVSSRNDGVLGKAVFDNVSTSGGGPSVDTTPPVISLLGDNPLVVDLGDTYVEPGATATDNVDGDLSGSIVIDAGSVDTGTVGSYQVSYDVTDSSNNAAATVTRTVNVVDGGTADTTPPVIALLGDNPLVLNLGDTYVEPGATATDNVDGDLSGSIVIDAGSVDTGTVGSYQVSYDVTDSSNNAAATVTRTVNVVDGGSGDCGPLPSPWVGADIGDVGADGSSCYVPATGTFEVEGSGADIWGISDEFHYVYQPLSGDGEIIARVVSQDNTFDWAKAGVMIRNGSDPGAEFALMTMLPNPAGLGPAYAFQYRDVRGELLDSSNNLGLAFVGGLPYYIRLVREGNTFTGYASTTNGGWQFVGSAPVPMGQDVLIGLAVTSRNDGVLNRSVFENVSISTNGAVSLTAPLNNMSITPNPADNAIVVSFDEPLNVEEIHIFDMSGRLVKEFDAQEVRRDEQFVLEVNLIPVGTYIVRSKDENGFKYSKQMVIER